MGAYPVLNLKQIRKNKYKRMNDFITKTGLSRKTIERAESGQYKISDNSIREIADALGVEVDEIIDKDGAMFIQKSTGMFICKKH